MKTLKKVMLSAFVATLLISCAKTESEINTNLKTAQTSPSYYEDLYDQHINAAGFGIELKKFNLDFAAAFHPQMGVSPQIGLRYRFEKKQ